MGATSEERYAVVSCHVERPLDDAVWTRFALMQAQRPGRFAIAALMRPADAAFGEDAARWLERARQAAERAPFGHHTHWTSPDHARPTAAAGDDLVTKCHNGAGTRVRSEGARLREAGLAPTLFCGGGWYTDQDVAEACAELGYVDCTPRASRPPYLPEGERWASLQTPARISLPSGRVLPALPTTHSLGDLGRAIAHRSLPHFVHVYFHDTDLLDRRRRAMIRVLLPLLARRARASDLDALGHDLLENAPRVTWDDVARL